MSTTSSVQVPTTLTDALSPDEKMAILADFWADRYSAIANYSSQVGTTRAGIWVDRKFSYSTNRGMFFAFIIVIGSFHFLHYLFHETIYSGGNEASAGHSLVYILLFVGISVFGLVAMMGVRRLTYRFFAQRWTRAKRNEFLIILSRNEYQSVINNEVDESTLSRPDEPQWKRRSLRRCALRWWINLNFFVPFSYKFIWWWTLIVGVATAEMDYFAQAYGSSGNTSSQLWLSFMRAIVISVIAYIATNIIRELLSLREHYVTGVKSAMEGNRIADQLTLRLSSFEREVVPGFIHVSKAAIGSGEIGNSLKRLLDVATDPDHESFLQQSNIFVANLKKVVDNFIDQINQPSDPFVKRCVLLTLNRYLLNEAEILGDKEKQKRIISQFSTLADIGKELIHSLYTETEAAESNPSNLEFYGLMVIPPKKFLNYNDMGFIGDTKWQDYLGSHIQAAKRKIPVKKYFLSLTANGPQDLALMESETSPEAFALYSGFIADELNSFVKIGPHGVPEPEEASPGSHNKKYLIEDGPKNSAEWQRLGDVINNIYHNENHCFIREFSKDEFRNSLWDTKRKLPLDYFAVRRNEEWIFCLQTRYHKNLDAADIEVLHKDMPENMSDEWARVKAKLDLIFLSSKDPNNGIFPIGKYRKQQPGKDAAAT